MHRRPVYKRLVHWLVGSRLQSRQAQRNAPKAPNLRLINSADVSPAVLSWKLSIPLLIAMVCCAALYVLSHVRAARIVWLGWTTMWRGLASRLA